MEAGTREFGMCTNSQEKAFSDYGTMLEIRDIQYFPDGRSVVDTMGGRRFKVGLGNILTKSATICCKGGWSRDEGWLQHGDR